MKKSTHGLTLVELMVVVAVIGIIAAVAYPSYESHVRKSRRAEAMTLLQAAQLAQERYRMNNPSYAASADFGHEAFAGICRAGINPCLSQNGYYELTATDSSAGSFTLRATPRTGSGQDKDTACLPALTVARTTSTLTFSPANCWSK